MTVALATETKNPQPPSGWRVTRVKNVMEFHNTRRIPLSAAERGAMTERRYDYYGASGIIDQVEHYLFDGTYILIAEDGANLLSRSTPLAFLARGQFWVNNHAHILEPRPGGDTQFYAHLLESLDYSASVTGAAQPKLTMQNLGTTKIAVPRRQEQERIAAYLEASCAAIDAAVAAKRLQLQTLDALRRAIISRAVTCGIGAQSNLRQVDHDWLREVPSHWKVCRVKRVLARMDYGISVSTVEEGRFPVLKMGHLQDGEIIFSNLDFVDDVDEELLLDTGDLLYNRTNSPDQVGKAAVFRKSRADAVTFASYLVRLRVNHRANQYFLNYVFNSDGFLGFARRLAIPSVQQSNLNSTRYGQMFIPLPPITEQDAICAHLDEQLAELQRIVSGIESQIETLTAYRKSLIHECVTGQRRITDADLNEVQSLG